MTRPLKQDTNVRPIVLPACSPVPICSGWSVKEVLRAFVTSVLFTKASYILRDADIAYHRQRCPSRVREQSTGGFSWNH